MTTAINFCIIDDEIDAQNVLLSLIEKSPNDFNVLGVAGTFEAAKKMLQLYTPDIVLLDINLGGKTGLELAPFVDTSKTAIVFITAYDNHVIDALRLNAFDYLFKPVFLDDFQVMIKRYLASVNSSKNNSKMDDVVSLSNNDGQHLVIIDEVEFIEAGGAYCIFNLKNQEKIMVSKPLKFYCDAFNEENGFYRTHKSFLVNVNAISKIIFGEGIIFLKSGKSVLISRNQKSNLKNIL